METDNDSKAHQTIKCFVMQYLMPLLVLQSSRWGWESWLLYFGCALMPCGCTVLQAKSDSDVVFRLQW